MNRFIIGYLDHGIERTGWCLARNAADAKRIAATISMASGALDDDLADSVWAEPWDDLRARDLDIVVRDEHDRGWTTTEQAHP